MSSSFMMSFLRYNDQWEEVKGKQAQLEEKTPRYICFSQNLIGHIVIREMSNDYFHCFVKCDIDLPLSILDQFFKA